jgi:hypothetical protein
MEDGTSEQGWKHIEQRHIPSGDDPGMKKAEVATRQGKQAIDVSTVDDLAAAIAK